MGCKTSKEQDKTHAASPPTSPAKEEEEEEEEASSSSSSSVEASESGGEVEALSAQASKESAVSPSVAGSGTLAATVSGTIDKAPAVAEVTSPTSPKHTPQAAAASPEDFMKLQPDGVYLVYDQGNNGTFFAKYSRTPVPGALAFATRGHTMIIPDFKYKQAKSVMTKTHLGHKNYYEAWCLWLKEARTIMGEFVVLPGMHDRNEGEPQKFPLFRMFLLHGSKLLEVSLGPVVTKPSNLRFTDAVAIVPTTYTGFDDALRRQKLLERSEFISKAKGPQDNAYIEF